MSEQAEDEAIAQLFHELGGGGEVLIGNFSEEGSEETSNTDGFGEALDAFALASCPAVEPPKNLRARVVAAATNSDTAPGGFQVIPWLAAACFALMAGASFLLWSGERKDLVAQVEASDLRVRELASEVDQSFKAFIVWDEARGAGVLKVDNLPALGEGGDYQLWVVSEGYEKPLDGGVFDTEDGRAEMKIVTKELAATPAKADQVTLFAISKERPGGVPVSETGQFVLTAAY